MTQEHGSTRTVMLRLAPHIWQELAAEAAAADLPMATMARTLLVERLAEIRREREREGVHG